ncbi:MAG: hypothetical protein WCP39_05895 [Chlamydiota bacterium]
MTLFAKELQTSPLFIKHEFLSHPIQIKDTQNIRTFTFPPLPNMNQKTLDFLLSKIPLRNFSIYSDPNSFLYLEILHSALSYLPFLPQPTALPQIPNTSLSIALKTLPPSPCLEPSERLSGVYPASNEEGWPSVQEKCSGILSTFPHLSTHTETAVAGTSALQNLSLFVTGNHSWLFILDPNDAVHLFWHNVQRIVKENSDAKTAIQRIIQFVKENKHLLGSISDDYSYLWEAPPNENLKISEVSSLGRFHRLQLFLLNPQSPFLIHYAKIHELFCRDHFFHLYIDLTNTNTLLQFASILKTHNIVIDILYTSNVYQWTGEQLFTALSHFYIALESPHLIYLQSLGTQCGRKDRTHLLYLHLNIFKQEKHHLIFSSNFPCLHPLHIRSLLNNAYCETTATLLERISDICLNNFSNMTPLEIPSIHPSTLFILQKFLSNNPGFQQLLQFGSILTQSIQIYNETAAYFRKLFPSPFSTPDFTSLTETKTIMEKNLTRSLEIFIQKIHYSHQKPIVERYEYSYKELIRKTFLYLQTKNPSEFSFFSAEEIDKIHQQFLSPSEQELIRTFYTFPENAVEHCLLPMLFPKIEDQMLHFLPPNHRLLLILYKNLTGYFYQLLDELTPILEQHHLRINQQPKEEMELSLCFPIEIPLPPSTQ